MKAKKISLLLIGVLVASQYQFDNAVYAASPEAQCFTELTKAAKTNPAFSNLDLGAVQKINGRNGEFKSAPFSVKTYADFINTFNQPVPFDSVDLEYYPNQMDNVATKYRFTPKVHKANRTNSGVIVYNDGVKTPIDYWWSKGGRSAASDIKAYFSGEKSASQLDAKYIRQKIDGYYLDSKYVTFGRESELDFAFPERAANPADDGHFSSGRPVMDMREYIIYTHHLSAAHGGDLLSCEVIKMVPQAPYKLKDYDYQGNSIRWENYGGTRLAASNVKTQVVGNGEFRKAEIDYTTTVLKDPDKNLLRFYVLSVTYNNHNSFLNTFDTIEMVNEAMRDAKNVSQNFLEMRRAFYDRIIASGLGIGTSGELASIVKKVSAPASAPAPAPAKKGGTVICTHYNKKGLLSDELYAAEKVYGKNADPRLYAGYLFWAKPFVAWLEKNEWADVVVAPLVNDWAEEVAFTLGRRDKGNWIGRQMMHYGEPMTLALGKTTLVQNSIKSSSLLSTEDLEVAP